MGIGQMWGADETISLIGATVKSTTNKTAADFSAESSLSVGSGEQLTSLTVGRSAATGVIFSSYDNKSNAMETSTTYYLVHPYNNGSKVKWSESGDNLFYVDFVIPDGYTYTISSIDYGFATNSAAFSVIIGVKDITSTPADDYTSLSIAVASGGMAVSSISDLYVELTAGTHRLYVNPSTTATNTGKYWGMSKVTLHGEYASASSTPIAVTAISLAPSSATIKVGKKVTLVPTITPSNATDKAVTWAVTSGSTYASVTDAGVVEGLAAGTAVVTATAHDGSGITQTATITVEDCPTSGIVYKFQVATDLTNGNIATSVPSDIPATTDNYLSEISGGTLTIAARSNVNRVQIVNTNAIGFANGADAFLKMELDCDEAEGDIIKYTLADYDMILMAGSENESTNKMTLDRKKSQVVVDEKLVGASALYMKRSSSSPKISYFEIYRPVYRTITLKYNDGETADGSIQVIDGEAATKPADPERGKYTFLGWFVGDTQYTGGETVNSSNILQASSISALLGLGTGVCQKPREDLLLLVRTDTGFFLLSGIRITGSLRSSSSSAPGSSRPLRRRALSPSPWRTAQTST